MIEIFCDDCLNWMSEAKENSIHGVITDPPYGPTEFSSDEIQKLRSQSGGVWRQPTRMGNSVRRPVPRFTGQSENDLKKMRDFFADFGVVSQRVLTPGAHIILSTNSLMTHTVYAGISHSGLEYRGTIVRLVQTLRGGDKPKNAEHEFAGVSTMLRSQHEPWLVFRKPFRGTVADCLRQYGTGALRRLSRERPAGDVIESTVTPQRERELSCHPSVKPQKFLREIAHIVLPLGVGTILDPFAGSGSTLAACKSLGLSAVGVEIDKRFFLDMPKTIDALADIEIDR